MVFVFSLKRLLTARQFTTNISTRGILWLTDWAWFNVPPNTFCDAWKALKSVFAPHWGHSRHSLYSLGGWGGGNPFPIPHFLDAFGVSASAPQIPSHSNPCSPAVSSGSAPGQFGMYLDKDSWFNSVAVMLYNCTLRTGL